MSPACGDRGFALTEALIAAGLGAVVIGAALTFLVKQADMASAHPDRADLQQRARAAAEILRLEIASAGESDARGGGRLGPACCVPVLLPRRVGEIAGDSPELARSDAITIVRARSLAIAVVLDQPLTFGQLWPASGGGCPVTDLFCGITTEDDVLVYGTTGEHDFVRVSNLAMPIDVVPRQGGPLAAHAAGSFATAVETRTLYFDSARRQLRMYDGQGSDAPIIDGVSAVTFEYWGTAGAPARSLLPAGTETCWFDAAAQPRHGRAMTRASEPDVNLPLTALSDGPWCGSGSNRFDADLLRVRRVRATIRLSAISDQARGVGPAFADPGRARASRRVPDVEVSVDIAPRALSSD
jgi:hypothetical protein